MATKKIQKVLNHLLSGRRITARYAVERYHYYRLASGINVLRDRGYDIKTHMLTSKDGARYAEYELPNPENYGQK